jgi:hypothetical protein
MNELQTRTFVDTALALWRAWKPDDTPALAYLAIRLGGSQRRQMLHLDASPAEDRFDITCYGGDDAVQDAYRHLLADGGRDAADRIVVPAVMLSFPRLATVKEKYLEIFREARMPHPAERVAPALTVFTAGGGVRRANASEHRAMLQILVALKSTGMSGGELFRAANGKQPLVELTIDGSPLRPQVTRGEFTAPPPWEVVDFRATFGDAIDIPKREIGDATWRADPIERSRPSHVHHAGCSHEHHDEVEHSLVLSNPSTGRVLTVVELGDESIRELIRGFCVAMTQAASKDDGSTFPKRIEAADALLAGFANRLLAAHGIECAEVAAAADYDRKIRRAFATEIEDYEHTRRQRAMAEAVTGDQWLECMRAVVETVTNPKSARSPNRLDRVLAHYYADSLVDEYRDDLLSDDVEQAARWGLATGLLDLKEYFEGQAVPAAAAEFLAALRAAKTALYRVSALRTEDPAKIELVELATGETVDVTWPTERSDRNVNSMLVGRVVALNDVKLFAEFLPAMVPAEAFSFLRDYESIGIAITDAGVDDTALGRAANWLYALEDEVIEPIEANVDNDLIDEWPVIAERETDAMRVALTRRLNFLVGHTLAEAAQDPRLALLARVVIHLWPAYGTADGSSVEPDRKRVARELGVVLG